MKNKFVYFLAGAFLFGLVIFVFQISQASPAIPNPGHGTSQIEGDADLNMNSNKIINVTNPAAAQDAATKAYVDAAVAAISTTPGVIVAVNSATCPSGWTRLDRLGSKSGDLILATNSGGAYFTPGTTFYYSTWSWCEKN